MANLTRSEQGLPDHRSRYRYQFGPLLSRQNGMTMARVFSKGAQEMSHREFGLIRPSYLPHGLLTWISGS